MTAWCLELHDLWLSKAVAGREKDREFCRSLLGLGVVDPAVLRERLHAVPDLQAEVRDAASALIPS